MKVIPIILSGGSGTRLWPLSRMHYPKQFLNLYSDISMFQETLLRLKGVKGLYSPIVVCNENHRFIVDEQLNEISIKNATILLEPIGRNTAPAIAAAAIQSMQNNPNNDLIFLVLSADHIIKNTVNFKLAIDLAVQNAINNRLVIFGIMPDNPNTGYGYIKSSNKIDNGVKKVEEFVEKPSSKVAKSYLQKGNYLWNSGMFVFSAKTLIEEYKKYSNTILLCAENSVKKAVKDLNFLRLDVDSFIECPSDSIDYALLEKSNNSYVIPIDVGWSDIGSWPALFNMEEKDINQNVIKGDVIAHKTNRSYISSSNRLIATIGLNDLIIIDTPDATLISSKDDAKDVKNLVESINKGKRQEGLYHRKVYRPWGWYDSIEKGLHFQVKRLHINPGAKLSLQMHYHRAEHWVVVMGIATVINGNKELTLKKGQSTYIPVETKHSLQNLEKIPLEIIEVQSGVYLEEDDIVRFEDIYGRASK